MKIQNWLTKNGKNFAPIILRLGVSLVFLWFGIMQVLVPENFVGYLPPFLQYYNIEPGYGMHGMMRMMGFAEPSAFSQGIVMANGLFEIVLGTLLIIGLFTRVSAFLLAAHLFVLTMEFLIEFGFTNEVFARDFGLTLAVFSVFLYGPDTWTLDKRKTKHKK